MRQDELIRYKILMKINRKRKGGIEFIYLGQSHDGWNLRFQNWYIWADICTKYLPTKVSRNCEDTYLILQNKYLCIFKHSFGAKILRPKLKKVFVYILKKICWYVQGPKYFTMTNSPIKGLISYYSNIISIVLLSYFHTTNWW